VADRRPGAGRWFPLTASQEGESCAAAVAEGELAALSVARDAGKTIERARAKTLQTRIRRSVAFARAMHRAHPVPEHWHEWLTEDTTVCRCEEVSYGEICRARDQLDAKDARTIKLLARPGMGWCQGRICGFATAKIAAVPGRHPVAAKDLVPVGKRSLASPVTLADLADADLSPDGADGADGADG